MGIIRASKRRRTGDDDDGKRDGLYHCDYCHKDLSTSLRIKCAVCADFDLCLECFSVGAFIKPHSPDHAYRVVDNLSFPVYTLDWGADEEMLLLEGVELYGLGNWVRVGEHVGKHAEDCKLHYFAVYVETDSFPEPKPFAEMQGLDIRQLIEQRRSAGAERIALARQQGAAKRGVRHPGQSKSKVQTTTTTTSSGAVMDATLPVKIEEVNGHPHPPAMAAASAAAVPTLAEAQAAPLPSNLLPHHPVHPMTHAGSKLLASQHLSPHVGTPAAAGFMSSEATPAAATLGGAGGSGSAGGGRAKTQNLAPPTSIDPGAPLMLSEAQQTGYHVKRNEFEPEYDHEAEAIISELEFPEDEPAEERAAKLRLIDIYNRRLDERESRHTFVLSRGLVNVKRQSAIDRRRAPSEKELLGRMRVLARYLPHSQWEALSDGVAAEGRIRARIAQLQQYRGMGMRTFDEVERYEAIESKKKKEVPPAAQAGKSRLQRIPVDETALEAELAEMGYPHAAAGAHAQHAGVPEGRGAEGLQAWRTRRGVLLDVAALPDIAPLTAKERTLCANERYLPAQYLAVKAEVLGVQAAKGTVSREEVQNLPFLVDRGRAGRLHEFFVEEGWVRPPPGGKLYYS